MDLETIEQRENTKAFNLADDPKKLEVQVKRLLQPYRFVLLMGLSGTGKSTFMDAYKGRKNWSLTKWKRDTIMDMLFTDGTRVEKYYNYLDQYEKKQFTELFHREHHQIVIEGWNRMRGRRTKYLSYMPSGSGRSAVFVFDGPTKAIINRNLVNDRLNLGQEEIPIFLKNKHSSTVWPTFDEGWNHIFYINTFGSRGEGYLRERLL
jgi:predicted kinase